jgi:hypothetical protein
VVTESRVQIKRKKSKLLVQIKGKMRKSNYSSKTIEAYIYWIKEFILLNNKKHPELLGENEIVFKSYWDIQA